MFAAQPEDQYVNAGTTLNLIGSAEGPGAFAWQWQHQAAGAITFTDLAGATTAMLTLPGIEASQAGRYQVLVTNSDGTESSREAVVTVAAAGAPLVKRILIPGDPIPGISGTFTFTGAQDAVINNSSGIAFTGNANTGGAGQGTYFRSPDGQFRFGTYQAFKVNLSDSGEMAQMNSRPITSMEMGYPDNIQLLARRNTEAPHGAGSYYLDGALAFDDLGTAAFRFDTNLGTAAFIGKPGAVALLGRGNGEAPGLGAGVFFEYVMDPVINPSGNAAFFATLTGTGITEENNTSLWKGTAAGAQRIVSESDPVPAAGSGVRVGDIRFPDTSQSPFGWNDAGQVCFSTTLAGTGITTANDHAILAGAPGALAVAARDGVADGHSFELSSRSYPIINRTGQVAFIATVTPTDTGTALESVWKWTPGASGGTRQLIAREGQQAPGLPAGTVMDSAELGKPLFSVALNGPGQLIVMSRLAGPGISYDAQNDTALYITNAAGDLKLVARAGGLIDLGGGVLRALDSFSLPLRSGGEDGRPRSFTESGEVIFSAQLKQATGLSTDYGLFTARLARDTAPLLAAYNTWAATAFPSGSPTGVTAPDANPDGDDVPNAIECLTGSNPLIPGPSALTVEQQPGRLRVTFPRRSGLPEGFELIETSIGLSSGWDPVGRTFVTRTDAGPGQPQTITVSLPADKDQRFVRLRAGF